MPYRQRRLPGALRYRLAHHRNRRSLRRGGGVRQTARTFGATDGVGPQSRGRSAGGIARDVRHHDEEFSSRARRAQRIDGGFSRGEEFHQLGSRDRSEVGLGERAEHGTQLRGDYREAGPDLRSFVEQLQALSVRGRDASHDRRLHPASPAVSAHAGSDRSRRIESSSAGAGIDGEEDSANGARRKVQHLSCRCDLDCGRRGGRAAVFRYGGSQSGRDGVARPRVDRDRSHHQRRSGTDRDHAQGWPQAGEIHRARGGKRRTIP